MTSSHIRSALRVSWFTIAWSAISGVAAIAAGLSATSLALVGSGASVLVDLSSSAVLVWRFRHPAGHETAEHRAQRAAAGALSILAVVLGAASIDRLVGHGSAHPTALSIVVAVASLLVLPVLAQRKYVIARRVMSPALRTDAHITVVGAANAALSLLGLALTEAGAGAADPTAALLVAVIAGVIGGHELRATGRRVRDASAGDPPMGYDL